MTITLKELEEIVDSRPSMTAEELDNLMRSCPEWVEQDRERRAERAARDKELGAEEAPLVAAISAAWKPVSSVYDLVNSAESYPEAIPVLVEHLDKPYQSIIRQGIARALTVKEARGEPARAILEELKRSDNQDFQVRWTLANALTVAADRSLIDDILKLATDSRLEEEVRERLQVAAGSAAKR